MDNYRQIVTDLMEHYQLKPDEQKKVWDIIKPVWEYPEFQRRMNAEEFPHHENISLGEHIISDTIVTYILSQKKGWNKNATITAMNIALFHDLYELPWQNTGIKKSRLVNKHGFTHPLEGAINAATWYPSYFQDAKEAEIIIDGVIHHMFPFPVRSFDGTDLELNTKEKIEQIPHYIKGLIITSSTRAQLGSISLCPSKFKQGRIMSKADKVVSFGKDLTSINGLLACITGHNKNLEDKSYTYQKK